MGAAVHTKKLTFAYYYSQQDWNELQIPYQKSSCRVLQHRITNEQVQLYQIYPSEYRDFQHQIKIYYQRYRAGTAVVETISAEEIKNNTNHILQNQIIRVLNQRIHLRFDQFCQLTFEQTLYVLCQALRGFHFLTKKVGFFEITTRMIGIDQCGKIKVWFNSNFSRNQPQFRRGVVKKLDFISHQSDQALLQRKLVRLLVLIVQLKCQQGHYPINFREKIYANSMGFSETFNFIQNYVKSNNVWVPRTLSKDTKSIVYRQAIVCKQSALNGTIIKRKSFRDSSKLKQNKIDVKFDESTAIRTEQFFNANIQNQFEQIHETSQQKANQFLKIYQAEKQTYKQLSETNIASRKKIYSQISINSQQNSKISLKKCNKRTYIDFI